MGNQGGVKMPGNLPIKKFRSGNIEAAIWSNKRDIDGNRVEFKTVSLSRSYKKKDENLWRSDQISSLRRNDIQKVILVLQKAQEELLLTEGGREDEEE